jgi:3-hydroxybutyryl-CoA dehydrogenase
MEASQRTQSATVPDVIGVIGAGIMGSGIAQLAAQTGATTLLYDAVSEGLERGMSRIAGDLDRLVAREKLTRTDADAILGRLTPVTEIAGLAPCGIVIEAAPERIELKRELFGSLADIVAADCVLATNTSSLSVTEIAAGTPGPERVVGLHFFNPAPVMKLVEVVAGSASSAAALARTRAVGEAMGKRVIDAADVAGFLVNRCARPYSLISLRLLMERVAAFEQVDRIARMEGGFRLGPFELMDLVGLDTNHAVAEAFQRQSYGEPRYQPSPLQARMIQAGHLGRKTGRGWYSYADARGTDYRPADPEVAPAGGGDGRVVAVLGDLPVAVELAAAAGAAGFAVARVGRDDGAVPAAPPDPWLTLICDGVSTADGPRALLLWDRSLHDGDPTAAGFHVVPPLETAKLIEVTSTPRSDPESVARLHEFITAIGRHPEPVADAPGLVLGRIVVSLINEAGFLIGEGNGTAADVDAGLTLGLNHPRGPVAWSQTIGLTHVVGLLDALRRELGEERYRVAPLLRRRLALGEAGLGDG